MTAISRRVLLKGLGVSIALPWLESMSAFGRETIAAQKSKTPQRFACLFIGDGISPPQWWSKGDGSEMELGASLESLTPFKEKLNVINGLFNREGDGGHARCTGNILSGANLHRGSIIKGGVSMDQKLAALYADDTLVPSLVLGCEQPVSGFHESQYSMVYASHISCAIPIRRSRLSCIHRSPSTVSSAARPASCKGVSSTKCSKKPRAYDSRSAVPTK